MNCEDLVRGKWAYLMVRYGCFYSVQSTFWGILSVWTEWMGKEWN